ncbi:hypothetical protein [Streptomyces sp. NBC_01314]|uniref:hypothetical protein n=1 Tax=Streptomyces sp. NBC_01314 TaxID=2903821 RepID=UPI003092EFA3|nr:hypothetical protein OG622_48170 [Streptomyces sp. NBC_01314]
MARLPVPQGDDPAGPVSGREARAVGGERERVDLLPLDEAALDDVPWDTPARLTVNTMDDPARSALCSSQCGKVNFPLTTNFTSNINKARNADSRVASAIPAL